MRIVFLFFFLLHLIVNDAAAQVPSVQWSKAFGGSRDDYATCVKQTPDGGYITGSTSWSPDGGDISGSHGVYDMWIVKYSASGDIEWKRSLGGSLADYFYDLELTNDGGYVALGRAESNDGDIAGSHGIGIYNIWVVKLRNNGTMEWQKCIGGLRWYNVSKIQPTSDGGYVLAGAMSDNWPTYPETSNDCCVIKISGTGDIQWEKTYGGSQFDLVRDIKQTADGGYIFLGYTGSMDGEVVGNHGGRDLWLVKLNPTGVIEWKKCFGGSSWEYPSAIELTQDGGYLVSANTPSNDGDVSGHHAGINQVDGWILKISGAGMLLWQKCVGGTKDDWLGKLDQTDDGGFIISGYSISNDGDNIGNFSNGVDKGWIIKISSSSAIEWSKFMGGSASDIFMDVQQSADGGYIIVGSIQSVDAGVPGLHGLGDLWLVKLAPLPCTPTISVSVSINNPCVGSPLTFTATASHGRPTSTYQWKRNGINVGQNSPTYSGSNFVSGDVVSCEYISNAPCAGSMMVVSNSLILSLRQNTQSPVDLGNDISICPGDTIKLSAHAGYREYNWQNASHDSVFMVTGAGTYYVTVTDSCGSVSSDTIQIKNYPTVSVFLPNDMTVCLSKPITISSTAVFSAYVWNTGAHSSAIQINSAGMYWLKGKDGNNCWNLDSVRVVNDCRKDFYIPTAFSPNGDNLNDIFKPTINFPVTAYRLAVYNRWGKLLFVSSDPGRGWNGREHNLPQESGVYIWTCNFISPEGKQLLYKGSLTLLR